MPSRRETLEQAARIVVGDREETYGGPEDSFATIAKFWEVYLDACMTFDREQLCLRPEDVAIMMMLLKIARLVKSSDHQDSWIDIAGYAACGAEITSTGPQPGEVIELDKEELDKIARGAPETVRVKPNPQDFPQDILKS